MNQPRALASNRRLGRCRAQRGLSLVEMIVAVLILGILMAMSMALYNSAQADAKNKQCRLNMQAIASAEEEYKAKGHLSNGQIVREYTTILSDLSAEITLPLCPNGGSYSASTAAHTLDVNGNDVWNPNVGRLSVNCSVHGSFTLGNQNR